MRFFPAAFPAILAAGGLLLTGCPAGSDGTPLPPAAIVTDDSGADAAPVRPPQTPVSTDDTAAPSPDGDDAPADEAPPKKYDPLFVGWPKPKAALFVTGRQHGYIEPCGCTGLANQKGGLARRQTLLRSLRDKGWPVVPLDVGNQVRRFGRQGDIKFQVTVEGLRKMGYRAVTFGPDDLRISGDELIALTADDPDNPTPFTAANVTIIDPELIPRYRVIEAGGVKIGVAAVLGESETKNIQNDDVEISTPAKGLGEVWPKLAAAKCDVYVLLCHASLEETKTIARAFPKFGVVITAGGAGEPMRVPDKLGDAIQVQAGTKGMYAGVIGVFDGGKLRYQRVPLDDRFRDSQQVLDLLQSYQKTLQQQGLGGLGLTPVMHPSGATFVGSEKCGECHAKALAVWKKTPHSEATQSLIHPGERSEIQRHHDPECLSCHVTGWNPQKYYPYEGGYLREAQKLLHGNGCENCHGPGSLHVAAEEDDAPDADRLQLSMRLPLAKARDRCLDCHDLDNDPDFQPLEAFEKYWKQIEHKGRD